ncbi:MAG: PAS domain S-box protein [Rhodospirillales bacterium]|nr:PAS domain S-box protein [Rhodospirillales bacterium]
MTDYKGREIFSNLGEHSIHLESDEWRKKVIEQGVPWSRLTSDGFSSIDPVLYLGNAEGAVVVTLGSDELPGLFDVGVQYNETVVVDAEDRIIYSSKDTFGTVGELFNDVRHRDWRLVSASLEGYSGVTVMTLQWQNVALATQQWMQNFLIGGILIALLVLGIAVAMTAVIAKRDVSRLSAVVRKISGTQDMEQRVTPSGPAELYALGNDFNKMLEILQRTTTSYEYVDSIISNTAEGIITIDTSGRIETYNQAAENMFGYSSGEAIGDNVSMLMVANERAAHDNYVKNSTIYAARIINKVRDLFGQRKDGTLFPMELSVAPMRVGGEHKFIGIFRDITERKEIDRAKSEFVSTVSHELRTPLTSIKGALGLIQSGVVGELPDKLKSMLSIAYSNSDRLVLLINDILDMEKISAGKMDFTMEPTNMVSLLEEAMEANRGYGVEHDVTFRCSFYDDNILVQGDKGRLMQVLSNLMSNAAKFSPDGERVELSVIRNGDTIRTAVKDNGTGIPENFRDRIFDKFTQADSSDTRQKGGTGLGLSITQAIVELHGGSIGFETETGKGSTFYFDLPELVG